MGYNAQINDLTNNEQCRVIVLNGLTDTPPDTRLNHRSMPEQQQPRLAAN
jgi:hypothetical protein